MKRVLGRLLAGLLATTASLASEDSLAFGDFEKLCREASPRPAALRAEVAAAHAVLDQARVMDGPRLTLDLSAGWVSRTQEMSLPTGTLSFGDGRSADAALNLNGTLWGGGTRQATMAAALSRAKARQEDERGDSLSLGHDLRTLFLRSLAAREVLRASQLSAGRLERVVQDLEQRRSRGLGLEDAVLAARSRLLQTRQDGAQRESEFRLCQLELGSLMGQSGSLPIPSGNLEESLPGLERDAQQVAALGALDARVQAAREAIAQRKAELRPKVDGSAAWHLARPGVDPIANEWMGYATAGVRLRWNLWDRNLTRRRVAEATHEARALEARRDEARRVADLALVQAKDQVDAARGQWRLAVERAEVEARRLPLMEARWRNGAATEKEWLDATDDLRMAEVERALGAARLRLAENRLLAAAGL